MSSYFDNKEFIEKLCASSPHIKKELSILEELTNISKDLFEQACESQNSLKEMATIRQLLERVSEMLRGDNIQITTYEFRNSNLLQSLEFLLTKTPSMSKYLLFKKKLSGKEEEMKHSEEIELEEL